MNKFERRNYPIVDLEVRSEEGKPMTLRGYAAVFDKLSVPMYGFREKIQKGAFAESLTKNNIKALWNHNSDFPLGSTDGGTLKLEEDERGLLFELELPDNSWGRDAGVSIQRKDVDGVSFGFSINQGGDKWDNTDPNNSIRTLIDIDLIEISPTPFPAYPSTNVSARSVTEAIEGVNFKEILRSAIKDVMQEERETPPAEPKHSIDSMLRRLELEENY